MRTKRVDQLEAEALRDGQLTMFWRLVSTRVREARGAASKQLETCPSADLGKLQERIQSLDMVLGLPERMRKEFIERRSGD